MQTTFALSITVDNKYSLQRILREIADRVEASDEAESAFGGTSAVVVNGQHLATFDLRAV